MMSARCAGRRIAYAKPSHANSPEKTALSGKTGAHSGTLDNEGDADLAEVVALWPSLPKSVRGAIQALATRKVKV
jgi:hypothetical protein